MSDTSAPPLTLVEFLTARLDERETAARRATGTDPGIWVVHVDWPTRSSVEVLGQFARPERSPLPPEVLKGDWYQVAVWGDMYSGRHDWRPEDDLPVAEHIAVNDPEYVLADVAAKRAILRNAKTQIDWADQQPEDNPHKDRVNGAATAYEATLELLAVPYRGHPDFREEWE